MQGLAGLEGFLEKAGPYIGPRGGKYADPDHKIPWAEGGGEAKGSAAQQAAVANAKELGISVDVPSDPMGLEMSAEAAQKLKQLGFAENMLAPVSAGKFRTAARNVAKFKPSSGGGSGLLKPNQVKVGQTIGDWKVTQASGKRVTLVLPGSGAMGSKMGKPLSFNWDGTGFKRQGQYLTPEGFEDVKKSGDGSVMLEDLNKAKYVRRTGSPGNYKYEYANEGGSGATSGSGEGGGGDRAAELAAAQKEAQSAIAAEMQKKNPGGHKKKGTKWTVPGGTGRTWTTEQVKARVAERMAMNAPKDSAKAAGLWKEVIALRTSPEAKSANAFVQRRIIDPFLNKSERSDAATELLKAYNMPSCDPKQNYNKGPMSPDGGELEGVGKTSGEGSGTAGPGRDPVTGQIKAPAPKKEKLSEDDADEEDQMKPHEKPIQRMTKSYDGTPQSIRDQVAHANARVAARLQKGPDYITVGPGRRPSAYEVVEKSEQAKYWARTDGAQVVYSNASDLAIERMQKSSDFYHGEHIGLPGSTPSLLRKSLLCKSCEAPTPAFLTACPACGDSVNAAANNAGLRTVTLTKSEPGLKPAPEKVLTLPNGLR